MIAPLNLTDYAGMIHLHSAYSIDGRKNALSTGVSTVPSAFTVAYHSPRTGRIKNDIKSAVKTIMMARNVNAH